MNFDQIIDRKHTESAKWHLYDQDVLPMWLADMDFSAPEPVIQALQERVVQLEEYKTRLMVCINILPTRKLEQR